MPILPLIDLMILIAWTSLLWGLFHKAIWMALATRFTVLGLTPYDFVLFAAICLLFALALAGRVWVKANEPRLLRRTANAGRHGEPLPEIPSPHEEAAAEERTGGAGMQTAP